MSKVAIIIPCFNHGAFIGEALNSLNGLSGDEIEVVIINDGSTDPSTLEVLQQIEKEGWRVIHQANQGLGKTRNNGIKATNAPFILPLDSDNRINPDYIRKATALLKENPEITVVYSNPRYFGEREGIGEIPDFNLQKLMLGNYIDACAVYRRSAWEAVGGYDENMPFMGVEDWEFWLNLAFHGYGFYHINEALYDYRVAPVSMIKKDTAPNFQELKRYIETKHKNFLDYTSIGNYISERFKAAPMVFLFKLLLRSWFPGKYFSLVNSKKMNRI